MRLRLFIILVFLASLAAAAASAGTEVRVRSAPREAQLAASLEKQAQAILIRLEKEFGLPAGPVTKIVLADSASAFRAAQPGDQWAPSWAAGLAYPSLNLIILKSPKILPGGNVERVLRHELAHLVLARLFGRHQVPRWLNEGLTMHLADEWGVDRQFAMARALAAGRVIPLNQLAHGFPEERFDAQTAYAESYYFISFLRDRYGGAIVGRLVNRLASGASFDRALESVTGSEPAVLEDGFHAWLSGRFSLFWLLIGPAGLLWFMGAVVLILAYLRRRRAAARRMAEWEAEEEGIDE